MKGKDAVTRPSRPACASRDLPGAPRHSSQRALGRRGVSPNASASVGKKKLETVVGECGTETELRGGDRPCPPRGSGPGPRSASLIRPLPLAPRWRGWDTQRLRFPRGGDPASAVCCPLPPSSDRCCLQQPREPPGTLTLLHLKLAATLSLRSQPGPPRHTSARRRAGRTQVSGSAAIPGAPPGRGRLCGAGRGWAPPRGARARPEERGRRGAAGRARAAWSGRAGRGTGW